MTRVVNVYRAPYDVYIGRYNAQFGGPSIFANPYHIGRDGSRDDVIEKYAIWLWCKIANGDITKEQLLALEGKTLGCFCKPKACHGDVLAGAIDWAVNARDRATA